MKSSIMIGILIASIFSVHAMDKAKEEVVLTFSQAQQGEQLDAYKKILFSVYTEFLYTELENSSHSLDTLTQTIHEKLNGDFAILLGWIGKKGKQFVKIDHAGAPVGFTILESLNDADTQIAIHHSPLLPGYKKFYSQHIKYVKEQYPQVKEIFASAKAPALQALVRSLGFVEDNSHIPNKEIVPDPAGFIGFKKSIE